MVEPIEIKRPGWRTPGYRKGVPWMRQAAQWGSGSSNSQRVGKRKTSWKSIMAAGLRGASKTTAKASKGGAK